MATMRVEIVSTEEHIYSGEVEFLVAPAAEGEIGVYPRHIALLTRIKPGVVRLTIPGEKEQLLLAISGGMMEVQPDQVTILADTAVRAEGLDLERAQAAKQAAEAALVRASDDLETAKAHAALATALAELKTLEYLRRRTH